MQDGMELAEALLAYPADSERALLSYEERMFPRSALNAEESWQNPSHRSAHAAPLGVLGQFFEVLLDVRSEQGLHVLPDLAVVG